MKNWQVEMVRFLQDRLDKFVGVVTSAEVREHLKTRHYYWTLCAIGWQLRRWGLSKKLVQRGGRWQRGRKLDRAKIEELVELSKGGPGIPGGLPFFCYFCNWSGYAVLKADEIVVEGCRIVQKSSPNETGRLCLCPKCQLSSHRAYFKKGMEINWKGGEVLFAHQMPGSGLTERGGAFTLGGYHGPGMLEPDSCWK